VTVPKPTRTGTFASLANRDFALFLGGLLVTGTGGWVQRIAQDWLVLTLTDSPTAVGLTTACQFVPTLVLGLHGGLLADRFPKRRVLQITQASMALGAAVLSVLTLTGHVTVWQVYALALWLGVATAIDNPVRQSFVTEIVGTAQLRNAISLVSSTFQIGAMAGPVIGGLLMSTVGAGYAFALNAVSFVAPLTALALMRPGLDHAPRAAMARGIGIAEGLRYARLTPSVLWPTVMVGTFGFFTISLPVTLAAMAKNEFHSGPGGVGLLNAAMAVGALAGAITTARRTRPIRLRTIALAAWPLAGAQAIASLAPTQSALMAMLMVVGAANLAFLTRAQSLVQLTVPDHLRGRVVGLYMLVFIGSGALGGPAVGLVDEHLGARVGLLLSGVVPALVTGLVARHLMRRAAVRVGFSRVTLQVVRPTIVERR
jgi:MFS family permease